MAERDFHLSRDDIARQIHHSVCELYPGRILDGNIIHKMLIEKGESGSALMFPAGEYAQVNGLEQKEFVRNLYHVLNLEMEKNLNDKFLFEILVDDNFIYFKLLDSE